MGGGSYRFKLYFATAGTIRNMNVTFCSEQPSVLSGLWTGIHGEASHVLAVEYRRVYMFPKHVLPFDCPLSLCCYVCHLIWLCVKTRDQGIFQLGGVCLTFANGL